MNIVLVIFDSLRRDCVGAYGSPPWWRVATPQMDRFAAESTRMDRAYPESLPTLPARRAIYTGQGVYPFSEGDFNLKGDFRGAPGWGPIPEDQPTMAEILGERGYRTGLVSDVYHMFKPSKNFWRGFHQWIFLRGKEKDPARSGPRLSEGEIDHWLPQKLQDPGSVSLIDQCITNMRGRPYEEDHFAPRVFKEACTWLEQNQDAPELFLTVECFDPHGPLIVPPHYRRMYDPSPGREQIKAGYLRTSGMDPALISRTRANYCGLVTLCDRWFGHMMETLRVLGMLDDTIIFLTADHGHSLGDAGWLGKRGYPSRPEVFRIPLLVRHPEGQGAGRSSDLLVQHTDITATILEMADALPAFPIHGRPFWSAAVEGGDTFRDHVTVGWGSALTVIDDRWWFNCKVNGKGPLLYDLDLPFPFEGSVADGNPGVLEELFSVATRDAGGGFPDWLVRLADEQKDAPGCSDLVARPP